MEPVEFVVGDETIVVTPPSPGIRRLSENVYRRAFQRAASSGTPTRKRQQDAIDVVCTPTKTARYEELLSACREDESLLAGEITVEAGKVVANRLARNRAELRRLLAEVDALEQQTAESKALQSQFEFLVVASTHSKDGTPCFPDVAAFVNRLQQEDEVARRAHWAMAGMLFGLREDFEENLPENVFFRRHGLPAEAA